MKFLVLRLLILKPIKDNISGQSKELYNTVHKYFESKSK